MDIGMLWFDDDSRRSLPEKVARAVDYYKEKYGTRPTVCFVNPVMLKDKGLTDKAGAVPLRPARNVLVDHFWLGVGDGEAGANGRSRVKDRAEAAAFKTEPAAKRPTARRAGRTRVHA